MIIVNKHFDDTDFYNYHSDHAFGGMRRFKLEVVMKPNTLTKIFKDESGATAIEYGLIAALVSVAAIVSLQAMGGALDSMFATVKDYLNDATP